MTSRSDSARHLLTSSLLQGEIGPGYHLTLATDTSACGAEVKWGKDGVWDPADVTCPACKASDAYKEVARG